jgi:aubergine
LVLSGFVLQRYNKDIRHKNQPLLISKSKSKEMRAGLPESVYLVPELCRLTGLTDDMRANFKLMSALATHTRVGPSERISKLLDFSKRLRGEQKVITRWLCNRRNSAIEQVAQLISARCFKTIDA